MGCRGRGRFKDWSRTVAFEFVSAAPAHPVLNKSDLSRGTGLVVGEILNVVEGGENFLFGTLVGEFDAKSINSIFGLGPSQNDELKGQKNNHQN